MPTRRILLALALLAATPRLRAGQIDRRRLHHLDAGFRPVRPHPAAVQGEDRHRREGGVAGHRAGARHRPARRRRRRVRARQAAGGEIRRRRLRREALPGDVQRLHPGRPEERPRRRARQATSRRGCARSRRRARRSSRAATSPAPMPPSSRSGRPPASTSPTPQAAEGEGSKDSPGTARSARAWGRRSIPPRPRTPIRSPTAAPGSRSRTAATSPSWSKATSALFNQYGVMLVNPAKHPHVKKDARPGLHRLADLARRAEGDRRLQDQRRAAVLPQCHGAGSVT